MMHRRTIGHRLCFATIVAIATTAVRAQSPAELDRQLAAEPASVTTPAGRTFRGLLDGWRDGRLYLRAARDGGEVGYSFTPAEIARLELPGAELQDRALDQWERGEAAAALPWLDALTRQRLRYLPVLDESQRRPLIACVTAQLRAGVPLLALGYAEQVLPVAQGAGERAALLDARLLATMSLGLKAEVGRLAQAWCMEAGTPGRSALGWSVLSRLAFEEGDADRALWLALQPIVLAGQPPAEHLDRCYTLAVCAAHRLGLRDYAAVLFREAGERGLSWTDDPAFFAIHAIYKTPPEESPSVGARSPEPPARAPSPDRHRTLQEARKLLGPPLL
jgi:hypothetical protein